MTWFRIFLFELQYRKERPVTYIYFGILFLVGFFTMSSDVVSIGGGTGLVKENAPTTIATMMVILSGFMMMITSAIMGVAVLRDFEHNTHSMIFTSPITKFDYLIGRFLGSFVITVFVFSGMLFGFMLGEFMPWRDPSRLLSFNLWNYLQPFLVFSIPNLFFMGILFFFTGALSRKMMVIYVQWIVLFAIYQLAVILTREIDNRSIAALLDPIGLNTIRNTIQYWTVAEQNTMNIAFKGMVFWNRALWLGVGLITMVIGYRNFNFAIVKSSIIKPYEVKDYGTSDFTISVPRIATHFGPRTYLIQLAKLSNFYFKYILRGIPFWSITGFGFLLMVVNSFSIGQVFGSSSYPTTYLMLELITGDFTIFFVIILVFYVGELVWRERDVNMDFIQGSLPVSDFVHLFSKFLGLIMVFVVTLLSLIAFGVIIQAILGYYKFDLLVYFGILFSETLSLLVLFSAMAFFIQVLVNKKFLGHALMILFFIVMGVLDELGLQHNLFQFGGGNLGIYSDMNGFGHFVRSFLWFDIYWLTFISFLFPLSVALVVRGTESGIKQRWKAWKSRLNPHLIILSICSLMLFGLSGFYIFYNTNILNTFKSTVEMAAYQATYEKKLKKYEFIKQPKIVDTKLKMEIYPETRDYTVKGTYVLKNYESEPIQDIHVQLGQDDDLYFREVTFNQPAAIKENYEPFRYYVYQLKKPLLSGDSMELHFQMEYITRGFKEDPNIASTSVVYNGTFLNNMEFPSLGYSEALELTSDNSRKKNGLPPKNRMKSREDSCCLGINFVSDDSHGTGFDITIGTTADQIAVAPGYLQNSWVEDERRYFHYKMDQPMIPFFSIVSARYEVLKDQIVLPHGEGKKEVDLEIYYHKGHEYNLESMMQGMKNALTYFSENFGPYQYKQMRILEYPRYTSNAQSFANTVPFSEGIGFMTKVEKDENVDVPYFVTAHEMAHQWWGHQLQGANVQGSSVFSETLSQYSALMVMKQKYSEEQVKKYLKQELNRYLRGRTTEQKREMPLAQVENQQYIHYGKGANIMYALQDYIGEDHVNRVLRHLLRDWKSFESHGRYVTTTDLLEYLREETPDSLQNVITDFFERIILYENRVIESSFIKKSEHEYLVDIQINTQKIEADSIGNTRDIMMNDWIDVGVFTKESTGKEKLIYLQKHHFKEKTSTLRIKVNMLPSSVGIDPYHKLIDRTPSDNTVAIN